MPRDSRNVVSTKVFRTHRTKPSRPHQATSNFIWPHPLGARTSCNGPGKASLVAAKDRYRWGQNLFANDLGGAKRSSPGGAGTSSQNQPAEREMGAAA